MRVLDWLTVPKRKPLLYFAMGVIFLVVAAVAFDVHERQVERHARNVAIEQAAKISYRNQLASCERGLSVRRSLRANAQATQKAFDVLAGFFTGARPRALAQSRDPNISKTSRVAAKASVASIDHAIHAFSAQLSIPPPPMPCDEVITDPTAPTPPHHN